MRRIALATLALLILPFAASAEEGMSPEPFAVGQKVDFSGTDPDGKPVGLADLVITKEKAWAAVRAAAEEYCPGCDPKPDTKVADLPGLKDDEGGVDQTLKHALVSTAGRPFGLVASEETEALDALATLGDVSNWITASEKSPIVVLVWSPRCPACKNVFDERLVGILGTTGARLVALASDYRDTPDEVKAYLEAHGWAWRVIMDTEQKVTDLFGGKRTPHAYLLDSTLALRYHGAIAAPPDPESGETEEREVLRDAIDALQKGEAPPVEATEPVG